MGAGRVMHLFPRLRYDGRAATLAATLLFLLGGTPMHARESTPPEGWTTAAPRAEIRPEFSYDPEGGPPRAEPEYPADGEEAAPGWVKVAGTYRAPSAAGRAVVELEFRWAPRASVAWSEVALVEVPAPHPRTVRLATVHFRPREGKTPA